jgi:hypothetical protein
MADREQRAAEDSVEAAAAIAAGLDPAALAAANAAKKKMGRGKSRNPRKNKAGQADDDEVGLEGDDLGDEATPVTTLKQKPTKQPRKPKAAAGGAPPPPPPLPAVDESVPNALLAAVASATSATDDHDTAIAALGALAAAARARPAGRSAAAAFKSASTALAPTSVRVSLTRTPSQRLAPSARARRRPRPRGRGPQVYHLLRAADHARRDGRLPGRRLTTDPCPCPEEASPSP